MHRPKGICWEYDGDGLYSREKISKKEKKRLMKKYLKRMFRYDDN